MGRPLNKRYFMNQGADPNLGLSLTSAWINGKNAASSGFFIVSQRGTGRFLVSNGTDFGIVSLVDHEPTGAGQGTIVITNGNQTEYVRTIYNHTVRTHSGNTYKWNFYGESDIQLPVLDIDLIPEEPTDPEDPDTSAALITIVSGIQQSKVGYKQNGFGSIDLTNYTGDLVIKGIYFDNTDNLIKVEFEGDYTPDTWVPENGPTNNISLEMKIKDFEVQQNNETSLTQFAKGATVSLLFRSYDPQSNTSVFDDVQYASVQGTGDFIVIDKTNLSSIDYMFKNSINVEFSEFYIPTLGNP